VTAGERALRPAVRQAGEDELVIADGFSCREQIAQRTSRRALHVAQVVRLALEGAGTAVPPERGIVPNRRRRARRSMARVVSRAAWMAVAIFLVRSLRRSARR
jgi:hypothetical protein